MEQHLVPFHDQDILCIRDAEGNVFVPMKRFVDELGVDWDTQRRKIRENPILNEGAVIMTLPSAGGEQETLCLDMDLLPLYLGQFDLNRIPNEEVRERLARFQREVGRALRDYFFRGAAINPRVPAQQLPAVVDAALVRARAERDLRAQNMSDARELLDFLGPLMDAANVGASVKLLTTQKIFTDFGVPIKINIPASHKLLEAGEVAERLGMYSTSGNPHRNAAGVLLREILNVPDTLKETVLFGTDHHQGTTVKYREPVVDAARAWLTENDWPVTFTSLSGTTYRVRYGREETPDNDNATLARPR